MGITFDRAGHRIVAASEEGLATTEPTKAKPRAVERTM